jgi:hypothetical protein
VQTGPGDRPVPPRKKPKALKKKSGLAGLSGSANAGAGVSSSPAPTVGKSEVKDTKGAADVKRAQPTVRKELARIRQKQSEVKDTKGNADRVPEKQRQKEKQAGIRGGTRQNYVPHYTIQSLEDRAPSEEIRTTGSVGKRVIRPRRRRPAPARARSPRS